MNGKKLIAFGWWTFAYFIVAAALFTITSMGDCFQGAEGAACRAQSSTFTRWLITSEILTYALLTWAIFFRRR